MYYNINKWQIISYLAKGFLKISLKVPLPPYSNLTESFLTKQMSEHVAVDFKELSENRKYFNCASDKTFINAC